MDRVQGITRMLVVDFEEAQSLIDSLIKQSKERIKLNQRVQSFFNEKVIQAEAEEEKIFNRKVFVVDPKEIYDFLNSQPEELERYLNSLEVIEVEEEIVSTRMMLIVEPKEFKKFLLSLVSQSLNKERVKLNNRVHEFIGKCTKSIDVENESLIDF